MPISSASEAWVGRAYHYKFTFQGSHYHGSTGCETLDAAKAWLKAFRDHLALEGVGAAAPKSAPCPTLRYALGEFLRLNAGVLGARHLRNIQCAMDLHWKKQLAMPLDQITAKVVEGVRTAYLASRGTGHRPGQKGEWELAHTKGGANKIVQHLRSVCAWTVGRGMIRAIPFALKPLKPQEEPGPVLWPELAPAFFAEAFDNGRKLLTQPFAHAAVCMRLMAQLGLREGEALGFRLEWLGRRRSVYVVGESKNRKIREVPVPPSLMDMLERIIGPTTAPPHGYLLLAEDGQPHRAGYAAKACERCGIKAGIHGLHPHRLRATFATTHFEADTPISQIQQMMGHDDPETTMRYIVQRPKDQARAQETVESLMGFETPKFEARGTIGATPNSASKNASRINNLKP